MQIMLVHRKYNKIRWVTGLHKITPDYAFALSTTDVVEVNKIIQKYEPEYKIYLIDKDGVVLKKIN